MTDGKSSTINRDRCRCECHTSAGRIRHVAACCCIHRYRRNCPQCRNDLGLLPQGEPE